METAYPEPDDSPEAREGTAGHYYGTERLEGRTWPVGTLAPNGHPIDRAMVEGGELLFNDVQAELQAIPPPYAFKVETKVFAHTWVHPKNEGTPDAFLLSVARRVLIVWDYKYGHLYVDPFRSGQCVNYVAAIFESYGITREEAAGYSISIRIVQPRNYHRDGPVRRWDTTGATVLPLIDALATAAREAKQPDPPTKTGPWCRDCSGRRACDAFMRLGAAAMQMAGDTTPHELPPAAMGLELLHIQTAIKALEARKSALEEIVLATIERGGNVPFWGKGYVDSKERWKVDPAAVFFLGDAFGVNLRKPQEPITPAAARKLVDPAVISEYAEKPRGAAKLVPVDETAAARVFGG